MVSVLVLDLAAQRFRVLSLDGSHFEGLPGGRALGVHLLGEWGAPDLDPLAPEAPVVFAVGPATGAGFWGTSRYGLFARSPATGGFGESYCGGGLGEALARTGWRAVVLVGAAPEPVWVEVHPEGANFHPAADLWGRDCHAAERELLAHAGRPGARAAVIGPAGENLVRLALVSSDLWRQAGRTGLGAVLGAKKVKGLVFWGDRRPRVADPQGLAAFAREFYRAARGQPAVEGYRRWGTPQLVAVTNRVGAFPSYYWRKGRAPHWERIAAEYLVEKLGARPKACPRCFIACAKLVELKAGPYAGLRLEGPEFETIYAFGGLCGIETLEDIIYLNDLCDRLGLDTISAGNLAGLVIEAARRGRLDYPLGYNDPHGVVRLLEDIAHRRGLGALLADGIRSAAAGLGLEDLAVHVKGLEPAGYDPRVLKGMALAYATSPRGACHLRSTFYKAELSGMADPGQASGKAELFADFEDRLTIHDCLIVCRFYRDLLGWSELTRLANMATGFNFTTESLREVAGQVLERVREFNRRCGFTARDDTLPPRLVKEPLEDSGARLTREELEVMLAEYYAHRGWRTP